MLGILLLILKIILWIILGILGLLLALILMILLVPIRYNGLFSKCRSTRAEGTVTYLFGLIRIDFAYRDGVTKYKVKILFFTVMKEGYEEVEEEPKSEPKPKGEVEKATKAAATKPVEKSTTVPAKKVTSNEKTEPKKSVESERPEQPKKPVEPKEQKQPEKKIEQDEDLVKLKEIKEKVQVEKAKALKKPEPNDDHGPKAEVKKVQKPPSKGRKSSRKKEEESSFEKAKRFYRFLTAYENQGLFKFVLRMIGKMIRSILPRKVWGRVNFGTDDPAITGYILAGVSAFYPVYRERFVITPDFEEVRFEGFVKGKGRIVIGAIVFYGVRVILDKRVRRLIKEARK